MNGDVLRYLRCPICGQPLAPAVPGTATPTGLSVTASAGPGSALRCPRGHTYDRARQGYVNLLPRPTRHEGDSAEMVAARHDFLTAGHYDPISAYLARTASTVLPPAAGRSASTDAAPPLVVDAGAGPGRHLAAVLDALPQAVGLALDVSKPALRRAARVHPRIAAARCDTWQGLPLADGAATLLLNVFAPRNGTEFRRVLCLDGALLVVTPAADHLAQLVDRLGLLRVDRTKQERVSASLIGQFTEVRTTVRRWEMRLRREEVRTLVGMGPSAWHTEPERLAEQIAELPDPVSVTAAVRLATYRPR